METPSLLVHEREHGLYDSDCHLHELFLVFHWAYSVCIHKTHANQQGKNVCVSLYDSMCKMDKVGKKMVSELVHRHTV